MKEKVILLIFISMLVFLTACDNSTPIKTQQAAHQPIVVENSAWMREKLPSETLAYARIPTLWQLFFNEKADGLHPAQKLIAHKTIINNLKKGLVDNYANKLPQEVQFPFELLLKNMSTPLELAVLNASDGSMIPNVMMATTFENTTKTQISELLELIQKQSKDQLRITKAFENSNFATLFVAMAPVFLNFDEKTGRLLLLSGLSASQTQLQTLLAGTVHAEELNDIFSFEDSVDVSGNNIETWINIEALYQQNKAFIPAAQQEMVKKLSLDKMKFLWVGTASSKGKSELIFKLAMPETGVRQFVAGVDSEFDVQTAGVPRSAWQITRPSVEQVKNAYGFALNLMPESEKIHAKTTEILTIINNYFGIELSQLLKIYGQKILIVNDDSGTWFASKIRDKQANKDFIEESFA